MMEMEYFVYILYSASFDRFYIGFTSNLDQRIQSHNSNQKASTFTSKYKPWAIVVSHSLGDNITLARKIERKLKSLKSKKMLVYWMDAPVEFDVYMQKLINTTP